MKFNNYSQKGYEIFDISFSSKTDLIGYLKITKTSSTWSHQIIESKVENRDRLEFTGVMTFEQAINLFENGWYENFQQFLEAKKSIDKIFPYVIKNFEYKNSINGGIPNIFNAINNIPLNMRKKILEEKKNIISIYVDASYPYYVSAETIFNYGVIILAFIDFFESLGYRVDLNFFEIAKSGNQVVYIKNRIKEVGEKINLQKVYFPFCHPAYLRRILFRVLETIEGVNKSFINGYGHVLEDTEIREILNLPDSSILFSLFSCGIEGKDLLKDVQKMIEYIKLGSYVKYDDSHTIIDNKKILTLSK